MDSKDKAAAIADYKAQQHVRIQERISDAKAKLELQEKLAETDPEAREALKAMYRSRLSFHRTQASAYERKLAALG